MRKTRIFILFGLAMLACSLCIGCPTAPEQQEPDLITPPPSGSTTKTDQSSGANPTTGNKSADGGIKMRIKAIVSLENPPQYSIKTISPAGGSPISVIRGPITSLQMLGTESGLERRVKTKEPVTLALQAEHPLYRLSSPPYGVAAYMQGNEIRTPFGSGMVVVFQFKVENKGWEQDCAVILTDDMDKGEKIPLPPVISMVKTTWYKEDSVFSGPGIHYPIYSQEINPFLSNSLPPLTSKLEGDNIMVSISQAHGQPTTTGNITTTSVMSRTADCKVKNVSFAKLRRANPVQVHGRELHFPVATDLLGIMEWQNAEGKWRGYACWRGWEQKGSQTHSVPNSWRKVRLFFFSTSGFIEELFSRDIKSPRLVIEPDSYQVVTFKG